MAREAVEIFAYPRLDGLSSKYHFLVHKQRCMAKYMENTSMIQVGIKANIWLHKGVLIKLGQ